MVVEFLQEVAGGIVEDPAVGLVAGGGFGGFGLGCEVGVGSQLGKPSLLVKGSGWGWFGHPRWL